MIDNNQVLLQVWEEVPGGSLDGEMCACISGVQAAQMMKFDLLRCGSVPSHEFGVVRLYRTFSNYIFTVICLSWKLCGTTRQT